MQVEELQQAVLALRHQVFAAKLNVMFTAAANEADHQLVFDYTTRDGVREDITVMVYPGLDCQYINPRTKALVDGLCLRVVKESGEEGAFPLDRIYGWRKKDMTEMHMFVDL